MQSGIYPSEGKPGNLYSWLPTRGHGDEVDDDDKVELHPCVDGPKVFTRGAPTRGRGDGDIDGKDGNEDAAMTATKTIQYNTIQYFYVNAPYVAISNKTTTMTMPDVICVDGSNVFTVYRWVGILNIRWL